MSKKASKKKTSMELYLEYKDLKKSGASKAELRAKLDEVVAAERDEAPWGMA